MLNRRNDLHWKQVIKHLGDAEADIKILSLHQGLELKTTLEAGVRTNLTKAIDEAGINLILAHHPHVARGVERVSKSSIIFYGLGNFLMLGAANMGPKPNAQDFGLFGRAYFQKDESGEWYASALEAVAITDMHLKPKPLASRLATVRLKHLNSLSQRTSGSKAVEFDIKSDGTGLACFLEPVRWPHKKRMLQDTAKNRVSKLCKSEKSSVLRPAYKPRWKFPATNYELPIGL